MSQMAWVIGMGVSVKLCDDLLSTDFLIKLRALEVEVFVRKCVVFSRLRRSWCTANLSNGRDEGVESAKVGRIGVKLL